MWLHRNVQFLYGKNKCHKQNEIALGETVCNWWLVKGWFPVLQRVQPNQQDWQVELSGRTGSSQNRRGRGTWQNYDGTTPAHWTLSYDSSIRKPISGIFSCVFAWLLLLPEPALWWEGFQAQPWKLARHKGLPPLPASPKINANPPAGGQGSTLWWGRRRPLASCTWGTGRDPQHFKVTKLSLMPPPATASLHHSWLP